MFIFLTNSRFTSRLFKPHFECFPARQCRITLFQLNKHSRAVFSVLRIKLDTERVLFSETPLTLATNLQLIDKVWFRRLRSCFRSSKKKTTFFDLVCSNVQIFQNFSYLILLLCKLIEGISLDVLLALLFPICCLLSRRWRKKRKQIHKQTVQLTYADSDVPPY